MIFEMGEKSASHTIAPALIGSLASLGGGLWGAVNNLTAQVSTLPDNLPVIGGLAIGVMGIGWSIYSAGPDRRVRTLTDEIATLRDQLSIRDQTIKDQDRAIAACLTERNRLLAEIGRLEGSLAKYQAQSLDARPTAPSPQSPPPVAG